MDYRQKLKFLRLERNLKQIDIAKVCNVSDATVGHWETMKRDVSIDCLIKLCRFYNVSADYILDITDTK